MSHSLNHTGKTSDWGGRRVSVTALGLGFALPIMVAGMWMMGVLFFASPSFYVPLIMPAVVIGLVAFLAAPFWVLYGKARWAAFGIMMLALAFGALLRFGLLHLLVAALG